MFVKVVKCKNSIVWYKDFIGEIFEVHDTITTMNDECYVTIAGGSDERWIYIEDSEIIKDIELERLKDQILTVINRQDGRIAYFT